MSVHYHAVVWIDHREARVFHFNAADVDPLVIHPDQPARHLHHRANSIGSGNALKIMRSSNAWQMPLPDAGAVLVTGPANETTELVEAHRPIQPSAHAKNRGCGDGEPSQRPPAGGLRQAALQGRSYDAATDCAPLKARPELPSPAGPRLRGVIGRVAARGISRGSHGLQNDPDPHQ